MQLLLSQSARGKDYPVCATSSDVDESQEDIETKNQLQESGRHLKVDVHLQLSKTNDDMVMYRSNQSMMN